MIADKDEHIKTILSVIPEKPGCYQYFDENGTIIYVGKAKNLKRRVSSYFNKVHDSNKTRVLVKQIRDIKYIVVDTEEDALLLENNLIKQYRPRYNVLLKDDKTYPSIVVKNEYFPRVFQTRNIVRDGSQYYGPYPSLFTAKVMLQMLKELYPLRTCKYPLTPESIAQGRYKVCLEYHIKLCKGPCGVKHQIQETIDRMKAEGRVKEIQMTIAILKKEHTLDIPKDLAYVEGKLFDDYIHDMKLTQQFAVLNRKAMVDVILEGMGLHAVDIFTTIHNYIDTDAMILRKGSVSAKAGEKLLIPINMRDGSLICIGKGNEEWNCSAPHGAGRLMSRRAALNTLSMDEFQKEMVGIYSTCVVPDTLDESPMAYKSMDEIVSQIRPTAEIVERIRPVYNFKASD